MSVMAGHDTSHIYQALVMNFIITVAKGYAAFVTGSAALMAETLHSFSDCGNQVLLLFGVRRAQKAPDEKHPLGYGRALYFWSFLVALMLFLGGGVFSIYEGFHHLSHPEPVGNLSWGIGILLFSLLLESWATWGNIREMNRRRGEKPLWRYLRETKDSDLVVIFGENSAATLGLLAALTALFAAKATGDGRFDAAGSLVVGLILVAVAVFLAVEVKSLLIGESADPEVNAAVRRAAEGDPRIHRVFEVITVQEGPGQVLVALKFECPPELPASELHELIESFEKRVLAECPEARWIFVEPDLRRST